MIFIYHDYGGTHTTSLAAAYHLNKLPTHRKLTKEEILAVDYFNQLTASDMGKLIFRGLDEDGNPVYTVGKGNSKAVLPAMVHMASMLQDKFKNDEPIIFSNTSPTVPMMMSIGGFLSRGLKLDVIGVPFLVNGAQQCCRTIYELVLHTKETAAARAATDSVIILDNQHFKRRRQ
ncbi:DUF3189 family protein [Paenibacillus lactis]|uniref:ABC transporter n=1 Tax=Paenibacillus lactis TaxID=228574 RepID=A0ABS4FGI5_9BACL|nr:DUF3189 family protein [Paenibacillus lactis]MBP1895377.1 hypothetical protein [Paenibacillus lactis]HAF97851.1 ABC transporter [Paenibacillus lactis]